MSSASYECGWGPHLVVADLVHEGEALDEVGLAHADVGLREGHRAVGCVEVEQAGGLAHAQKLGNVLVVGQGGTQAHDADHVLREKIVRS
eukprot:3381661-Pyramimonas_sp.AAC.1